MKSLKLKNFILVNIGLCLVGVIFVLIGIIVNGTLLTPLLESIGTGLLAAGLVNIFDRVFTLESPPILPVPKPRIQVVSDQRLSTPKEILDLKYSAKKVDLIGIKLNYFLNELIHDPQHKLISRLVHNKLQLRIFLVHPDSPYLIQRAIEDGIDPDELIRREKAAVADCIEFYRQLSHYYEFVAKEPNFDTHNTGVLQIKLLSFCPYITIYRIDDNSIYWGLYTSDKTGVELPLFLTTQEFDWQFYNHLHDHIHGLIERDKKYPDLVCMTKMGKPALNQSLVDSIFPKQ